MSDTAHLREPKPLSDEGELRAKIRDAYWSHEIPDNQVVGGFSTDWDAVTDDILQTFQSHTRQLEQRVLEAKPRSNFSVDDSGLDRDLTEYERGWNDALDDYSTRLKGVFNITEPKA